MRYCPTCKITLQFINTVTDTNIFGEPTARVHNYICPNCKRGFRFDVEDKDISENLEEIEDYER